MIKAGHLEAALKFAQKELSQKAKHHVKIIHSERVSLGAGECDVADGL